MKGMSDVPLHGTINLKRKAHWNTSQNLEIGYISRFMPEVIKKDKEADAHGNNGQGCN